MVFTKFIIRKTRHSFWFTSQPLLLDSLVNILPLYIWPSSMSMWMVNFLWSRFMLHLNETQSNLIYRKWCKTKKTFEIKINFSLKIVPLPVHPPVHPSIHSIGLPNSCQSHANGINRNWRYMTYPPPKEREKINKQILFHGNHNLRYFQYFIQHKINFEKNNNNIRIRMKRSGEKQALT